MSRFKSRYPRSIDDAIAEAVAAKKQPSRILAGIRSGVLPGLDGRAWPIAERTFYRKLAEARARIAAASAPGREGRHLLVKLCAAELEFGASREELLSKGWDLSEVEEAEEFRAVQEAEADRVVAAIREGLEQRGGDRRSDRLDRRRLREVLQRLLYGVPRRTGPRRRALGSIPVG